MRLIIRNLSKAYRFKRHLYLKSEERFIFKNVSVELERGENLLICGESGAGKSTLGKIIAMLEKPSSGEIEFDSHSILGLDFESQRLLRKQISYIFQEQKLALNPHKKVIDLLCVVSENFGKRANLETIKGLFNAFELDFSLMDLKARQLSSGQAQRIGLVRSMLLNPKLLILDEITAPLDLSATQKILGFLMEWQRQHDISYIFITHESRIFGKYCAKTLNMGEIAESK